MVLLNQFYKAKHCDLQVLSIPATLDDAQSVLNQTLNHGRDKNARHFNYTWETTPSLNILSLKLSFKTIRIVALSQYRPDLPFLYLALGFIRYTTQKSKRQLQTGIQWRREFVWISHLAAIQPGVSRKSLSAQTLTPTCCMAWGQKCLSAQKLHTGNEDHYMAT